jgi:glutamate formiminotransferase
MTAYVYGDKIDIRKFLSSWGIKINLSPLHVAQNIIQIIQKLKTNSGVVRLIAFKLKFKYTWHIRDNQLNSAKFNFKVCHASDMTEMCCLIGER